jgi:hypothetical protein
MMMLPQSTYKNQFYYFVVTNLCTLKVVPRYNVCKINTTEQVPYEVSWCV